MKKKAELNQEQLDFVLDCWRRLPLIQKSSSVLLQIFQFQLFEKLHIMSIQGFKADNAYRSTIRSKERPAELVDTIVSRHRSAFIIVT